MERYSKAKEELRHKLDKGSTGETEILHWQILRRHLIPVKSQRDWYLIISRITTLESQKLFLNLFRNRGIKGDARPLGQKPLPSWPLATLPALIRRGQMNFPHMFYWINGRTGSNIQSFQLPFPSFKRWIVLPIFPSVLAAAIFHLALLKTQTISSAKRGVQLHAKSPLIFPAFSEIWMRSFIEVLSNQHF